MWLHARVLCGCEAGCEVLVEHGAGSGDGEDKWSRCCRALIVGVSAALPSSRGPPPTSRGLGKRARRMLGQRVVGRGGACNGNRK